MAKNKPKEIEIPERSKYDKDFKKLNDIKLELIPSKYDDVYSTEFYSDELWDYLNSQQGKKPIDAITNVHKRIKKLSRKQLEIECLMLARSNMASTFTYISRQIAHQADLIDGGKIRKKLSTITEGTSKRTDQKDKAEFQRLYKENNTNISNITELRNLDWFKRSALCEYPDKTLKNWRNEIDKKPLKLGRTPKKSQK